MDENKLFKELMKYKKEDLASFMTGYFMDQDERDIQNMLKGLSIR